jgi:hypothetical protein
VGLQLLLCGKPRQRGLGCLLVGAGTQFRLGSGQRLGLSALRRSELCALFGAGAYACASGSFFLGLDARLGRIPRLGFGDGLCPGGFASLLFSARAQLSRGCRFGLGLDAGDRVLDRTEFGLFPFPGIGIRRRAAA